MNKSERVKLAMHAAQLSYGASSNHDTTCIGQRLLADFPSIKEEYDDWLPIFAAERLCSCLTHLWGGRTELWGGNVPICMYSVEVTDVVESMICEWGDENTPLTELIDQGADSSIIADSPAWLTLCDEYLAANGISDEVYQFITRSAE